MAQQCKKNKKDLSATQGLLTLIISRLPNSDSRESKLDGPALNIVPQCHEVLVVITKALLKINQLLALLLLDSKGDCAAPVKEFTNFLEVGFVATTSGHCWCTNAHTSRGQGRHISVDCVSVQ